MLFIVTCFNHSLLYIQGVISSWTGCKMTHLIPMNRVLEPPQATQLVKKFLVFYKNLSFTAMSVTACHWFTCETRWIHFTLSHSIPLMAILILSLLTTCKSSNWDLPFMFSDTTQWLAELSMCSCRKNNNTSCCRESLEGCCWQPCLQLVELPTAPLPRQCCCMKIMQY